MQDIDNQHLYWNKVAATKTFTHPLNLELLGQYLPQKDAQIIDFGCGYGRLVGELLANGYSKVAGYDTSEALIERGRIEGNLPIHHIASPAELPLEDDSVDAILLFAVLTCVPSNQGQRELITLLRSKLRAGGILYVSDYYLQADRLRSGAYNCLNDDSENEGVFTLTEGATLRHHSQAWIATLLSDFEILEETMVDVFTMNGNRSEAFQIIARRQD